MLARAAHGDLQAEEAAEKLLVGVLITKKVQLNVGKYLKLVRVQVRQKKARVRKQS